MNGAVNVLDDHRKLVSYVLPVQRKSILRTDPNVPENRNKNGTLDVVIVEERELDLLHLRGGQVPGLLCTCFGFLTGTMGFISSNSCGSTA